MINDFRLSGCGFLVVVGHCAIDDLLKMTHKIIIFFRVFISTTARIMHNFFLSSSTSLSQAANGSKMKYFFPQRSLVIGEEFRESEKRLSSHRRF